MTDRFSRAHAASTAHPDRLGRAHSGEGQLRRLGRVDKVLDRLLGGPLEHAVPQVEQVALVSGSLEVLALHPTPAYVNVSLRKHGFASHWIRECAILHSSHS